MGSARAVTVGWVSLVAAALGCTSLGELSARTTLNMSIGACTHGQESRCRDLGNHYASLTVASRMKEWDEPRNMDKARAAWQLGCELDDGESCRALLEWNLVSDPPQQARVRTRAVFYGKSARSPEELRQAETRLMTAVYAELNNRAQIEAKVAAEEGYSASDFAASLSTGLTALTSGRNPIVAIEENQLGVQLPSELGGSGASLKSVSSASGGGAASATSSGSACAKCLPAGDAMTTACKAAPAGASCYRAAAAMQQCTLDTGCSNDPAATRAEIKRMNDAAAAAHR